MRNRSARRRGVIYLDVGWATLPSLLRRSSLRRESWYLRTSLGTARGQRLLRAFRVKPIDIDSAGELTIPPRSTEQAMERGLSIIERQEITPLLDHYAARFPDAGIAAGVLRTVIARTLAERSLDAFYAETWARTMGFDRVDFVGAATADTYLLTDPEMGFRVVGSVSRAIAHVGRLRRSRTVGDSGGQPSEGSDAKGTFASVPAWREGDVANRSVLLVLNQGTAYGNLYAYDHLFSSEPSSPLHPSNVVVMARSGGPHNPEGIRFGYPSMGGRRSQARSTASLMWSGLRRFRWRFPMGHMWSLSRTCTMAEAQRASLDRDFPAVRLAILAYDLQVPPELVLALESTGISTVALNERPLSVVIRSQPLAVSTLLTASNYFSSRAAESPSVAVDEARAVGMWRTDLIHRYRAEPAVEAWTRADEHGRLRVLALPYHAHEGAGQGANPLATGFRSVRHFLLDLVALASERADLHIVVRGKTDRWLEDPRFADVAERVGATPNIEVDRDYQRLNQSYRLAAHADLVIAKYTSLVDECLALGIPCVVHDFTHNARNVACRTIPYVPPESWAHDDESFRARVDLVARDRGREWIQGWEPHRQVVFGDLNDGSVSSRARVQFQSRLMAI